MALSVGNFTGNHSNSSDNAPTVNVPSGGAAGDEYIFATLSYDGGTITPATGFTKITPEATEGSLFYYLRAWKRTYTGSEGATFAFSTSNYVGWVAACGIVKGAAATLVDANAAADYAGYISAGVQADMTTGSVTRSAAGQLVLIIHGHGSVPGAQTITFTNPAGCTTQGTYDSTVGRVLRFSWIIEGASGSTNYAGSSSSSIDQAQGGYGIALVFADAGGGGRTTKNTRSNPLGVRAGLHHRVRRRAA